MKKYNTMLILKLTDGRLTANQSITKGLFQGNEQAIIEIQANPPYNGTVSDLENLACSHIEAQINMPIYTKHVTFDSSTGLNVDGSPYVTKVQFQILSRNF